MARLFEIFRLLDFFVPSRGAMSLLGLLLATQIHVVTASIEINSNFNVPAVESVGCDCQ